MHKRYYPERNCGAVIKATESQKEYFNAISKSDYVTVEYLLKSRKIDINVTDERGKSGLFFAQDETMLKFLLEKGIEIDAQNESGHTALMKIVGANCLNKNDLEKARILIGYNADIRIKDETGNTALHHLIKGTFNVMNITLADAFWGAVFLPATALICNSMISESKLVRLKVLDLLLKRNPNIDSKNDDGETALNCAVSYSEPKLAQRLIAHGADLDVLYNNGTSMLEHAVKNGSMAIVDLMLKKKNSLNCENQALEYAQKYNKAEIILLIEDRKKIFARAAACVLF